MNKWNLNIQLNTDTILTDIEEAAKSTRLLTITYVDQKGKVSFRTVEPYEIKNNSLFAFCYQAQGIRQFKLDKIQDTEVDVHLFTPRFPILI